jgi:hypothetical protein
VFAGRQSFGFQYHGLTFQVLRQRVSRAATPLALGSVLGGGLRFLLGLVLEHVVAEGRLLLVLFLQVSGHFGQLAFLLRGEAVRPFAEKLTLQFGQFQEGLAQLRLQTFLHPQELRPFRLQSSVLLLEHAVAFPPLRQLARRIGGLHQVRASRQPEPKG